MSSRCVGEAREGGRGPAWAHSASPRSGEDRFLRGRQRNDGLQCRAHCRASPIVAQEKGPVQGPKGVAAGWNVHPSLTPDTLAFSLCPPGMSPRVRGRSSLLPSRSPTQIQGCSLCLRAVRQSLARERGSGQAAGDAIQQPAPWPQGCPQEAEWPCTGRRPCLQACFPSCPEAGLGSPRRGRRRSYRASQPLWGSRCHSPMARVPPACPAPGLQLVLGRRPASFSRGEEQVSLQTASLEAEPLAPPPPLLELSGCPWHRLSSPAEGRGLRCHRPPGRSQRLLLFPRIMYAAHFHGQGSPRSTPDPAEGSTGSALCAVCAALVRPHTTSLTSSALSAASLGQERGGLGTTGRSPDFQGCSGGPGTGDSTHTGWFAAAVGLDATS